MSAEMYSAWMIVIGLNNKLMFAGGIIIKDITSFDLDLTYAFY